MANVESFLIAMIVAKQLSSLYIIGIEFSARIRFQSFQGSNNPSKFLALKRIKLLFLLRRISDRYGLQIFLLFEINLRVF